MLQRPYGPYFGKKTFIRGTVLFLSIYLNCLQAGVLADSMHIFFGKAQCLCDDPCRLSRASSQPL